MKHLFLMIPKVLWYVVLLKVHQGGHQDRCMSIEKYVKGSGK